ncbi:MAG: UTP--glucose-1-phosphate uridylyltransferase [Halobacteriovoraceae bacterium]|nr:UTP--glucose-1-phosphate uridylyltransferase [Halobacteriovoraceae bacterium]|tara:strand:+ start:532 stop:1416 length:885 start_codon:yes stop_codon:yes gene_type:complete
MKIRKAVIPVAGKGTRFLPATKEIPKEMIPIVNKPMIHYAVEEAVLSGIEQIIFVTSSGKSSIEDYFDRNLELEQFLEKNGKSHLATEIREIGQMTEVTTVRQKEQLGLGHAINCAKDLIGDETFAVILADDLVVNKEPVTKQLLTISRENEGASVIGVMEVERSETYKYGIVDGQPIDSKKETYKMNKMVEKPKPEEAPTTLATPGRYILGPEIFSYLERIPKGVGGEYQLTDAINLMASEMNVLAHIFKGTRFDTGSIKGYLDATMEFALMDEEMRPDIINLMKEKITAYEN